MGEEPISEEGPRKLSFTIDIPTGTILSGERDFKILQSVGAGGMGAVFTAKVLDDRAIENGEIDAIVAIKVFAVNTGLPLQLERREIGVLKTFRHPNIVTMYDTGQYKEYHFAVLSYCNNGSVQDMLLDGHTFTTAEALKILIHMLHALVGTHSCGILHLDIKPANILINNQGDYLLCDFGAARTLFQQNQRYLLGTPFFMSPEHALERMDKLDARSDMYSLAATIWLMLYPEKKLTIQYSEIQANRTTETFPLLSNVVPEEDQPFANLVDRMLAYSPNERPGSVSEALSTAEKIAGIKRAGDLVQPADRGERLNDTLRAALIEQASDPIALELLTGGNTFYTLRMYENRDIICVEDSLTYEVYMLLHGTIDVTRSEETLFTETVEGTILGEVSALAGHPRTATLRASGDVILAIMNASELEQAARRIPALAVRIMKSLARRVIQRDIRDT